MAQSKATNGFLNRERLSLPKTGFLLVNTARAQLLEQGTLLDLLDDDTIGHYATDVFDAEPVSPDDPLLCRDDVTLSAHAAYMTEETYLELWRRSLGRFDEVQNGGKS